ncbi:MAG: HAMP domain-containing histidine kinase [Gammaproteobacteria bacterium]|nr:HAMP domain-containing histidine kinase [Gammaproteobacteria bacterium]
MSLFRTLYARLALALVLLLVSVGLIYAVISSSATRHHLEEVSQRLNRDLARNLVADRNLVEQGRLNEEALKETFKMYMVINPSIEIYLLDMQGEILSYSADPGKVKRKRVSLEPVLALLRGEGYPLLGDDPRNHDRLKAFSVTPVPSSENPEGYLYVVLRGEQFDSVDEMLRESYFLKLSGWSVVISLGFGLLMGLLLFGLLTRRLHRLARVMDRFQQGNFTSHEPASSPGQAINDEIDWLGRTFDEMAGRIVSQLQELQQKDALRRELVAHVSHDLRTPLASLRGYLESLDMKQDELSREERSEYVAIALRHSERLTRLVSELFELATLDARETRPDCEPFALAELVQDVVQKYQLRARQQGVVISMQPVPGLPFVSADIALTERVLENLLENAFSHIEGDGRVDITLKQEEGAVALSVSDNGCGIPDAALPHVFEPFYQADTGRRERNHTGLGLAISRRIVELLQGEIQVSSRFKEGATFTFSLPVWQH